MFPLPSIFFHSTTPTPNTQPLYFNSHLSTFPTTPFSRLKNLMMIDDVMPDQTSLTSSLVFSSLFSIFSFFSAKMTQSYW